MLAAISIEVSTSAAVSPASAEPVLLPVLQRDKSAAVIVMDTLSDHQRADILYTIEAAVIAVRFQSRDSSGLSPIEPG
ncbi:hypothetical protein [Azospirillum rugosum]|uniref:Uncharacterized protein n=1 Tax=Azospirillum rugosum TaxID=416170 RepID=A0ABS4SZ20_9PROT|nr:hypothetical protein [Azospirillum rugosum]MBP2297217.1 hypothetical protein [Azospirillum rugosum]MDQ0531059.1 hypothetical protein [Azospirillum rugosum]